MTRNHPQNKNKVKKAKDKNMFSLTTEKLIDQIELEQNTNLTFQGLKQTPKKNKDWDNYLNVSVCSEKLQEESQQDLQNEPE